MTQKIEQEYTNRHKQAKLQFEKASRQHTLLGFLRLLLVILGAIGLYYATQIHIQAVLLVVFVVATAFVFLVRRHNRIRTHKTLNANLLLINQNELDALQMNYTQFADGAEFADPEHAFAADLDLFGPQSLFQYLNRTCTRSGSETLARFFLQPVMHKPQLLQRQQAIHELAGQLSFRQNFQATGMGVNETATDRNGLLDWIQLPPLFAHRLFGLLLLLMPLLSMCMIYLFIAGNISWVNLLAYFVLPLGIVGLKHKSINQRHIQLSRKSAILNRYARLLKKIEQHKFSAERLVALQNELISFKQEASATIHQLSRILNMIDTRLNVFAGFLLNAILLWDILQMRRLERWQAQHQEDLAHWLEAVARIDALNSLAGLAYNHPDATFPDISEQGSFCLSAEALGHPLIHFSKRVNNPIEIKDFKQFQIITGANMAGKSTYLRTVGINLILAMMGAPVIARRFHFKPIALQTGIRTRDSLQANESYFFAELKRLKRVIDRLQSGEQLFIILDEILKGTNSRDKQTGSMALLEQLIRYPAAGLIATHDLALGNLASQYPQNIQNKRFEVEIENNQLIFDYKLKEGISQNLNATFLMRKMGITVHD